MNQRIARVVATALTVLGLAACGQSPDGGAAAPQAAANVDTESPEFVATEYRQGLMEVIAFKASQVRGMASGDIPVDETVFLKAANDLAAAAGMLDEAFPAGTDSESLAGVSNALPAIWADQNAFSERRVALQTAARTVAAQAQAGGFAAAQSAAAEQIGPTCGGCHRNYRQRTE